MNIEEGDPRHCDLCRKRHEAKARGITLEADTYVAANPDTGDRARIVATVTSESE